MLPPDFEPTKVLPLLLVVLVLGVLFVDVVLVPELLVAVFVVVPDELPEEEPDVPVLLVGFEAAVLSEVLRAK